MIFIQASFVGLWGVFCHKSVIPYSYWTQSHVRGACVCAFDAAAVHASGSSHETRSGTPHGTALWWFADITAKRAVSS